MGRNENEDLSGLNLPEGEIKEQHHIHNDMICAKNIYSNTTGVTTYYILCAGGRVFDPNEIDVRYKVRNNWKLHRVKKTVYDMYIKFLESKRKALLYQVEREI